MYFEIKFETKEQTDESRRKTRNVHLTDERTDGRE
jgi:hypothetical protein